MQPLELPVVPAPKRAELLGSWLLRIASIYGVSVPRLLIHLGINAPPMSTLHWSRLPRFGARDVNKLSSALHWPGSTIRRMQSRTGRTPQPVELGTCLACWRADLASGHSLCWRRHWVDPLALTCPQHRCWLSPICVTEVRRVRTVDDFIELAQQAFDKQSPSPTLSPSHEVFILEQALCPFRSEAETPFVHLGLSSPSALYRVVADLLRLSFFNIVGADTLGWFAQQVHTTLPEKEPIKTGLFQFPRTGKPPLFFTLPHRLSTRQALFTYLAAVLTLKPQAFIQPSSLLLTEYRHLALAAREWPFAFTKSLVPELAEWLRTDELLREKFSFSPRYFEERNRLGFPY
jgi:hypothetical protein